MDHEIRYVLSDDPDFDVARLKSVGGSKYIKIYDSVTKKLISIEPQEFVNLFSNNAKKLSAIIDACLRRNVLFTASEIVKLLKAEVDAAISNVMDDLKIVNYKGEAGMLPVSLTRAGDTYKVDGKVYVCFDASRPGEYKWGRVVFADELSSYYTKDEFDELYVNYIKSVKDWLHHDVYEYTKDFYDRFVKKTEFEELIRRVDQSIEEYASSLASLHAWRDETQARVDEFAVDAAEKIAAMNEFLSNASGVVSDWMNENNEKIDKALADLSSRYDSLVSQLSGIRSDMHLLSNEVGILSGEITQIRHGSQELVKVEYEA